MIFKRVFLMVADSVGIGAMEDAALWGDEGSNTIVNTIKATGIYLPNLHKMGLGNITHVPIHPPVSLPICSYGKAKIMSKGKDTTVGHWEMMGIITQKPFPTYPEGFPPEVIQEFEKRIGRKILGNYPASGTEIIKELGKKHMETGFPIVYTSADSVFQIAAHKEIIPLDELYKMCKIAREILRGKHEVARVIARPFIGEYPNFTRTPERKDFAISPPEPNLLSILTQREFKIISVGKIASIFAWKNCGEEIKTKGNSEGLKVTLEIIKKREDANFVFINLVDFDMLYGHRNDPEGYGKALLELDGKLPEIFENLKDDDLFILTADHGCDPTTPSTDHSREYVPIFVYSKNKKFKSGINLGIRESLSDMGQTIGENFGVKIPSGKSFLKEITYVN